VVAATRAIPSFWLRLMPTSTDRRGQDCRSEYR
jgi:hypothetical protein